MTLIEMVENVKTHIDDTTVTENLIRAYLSDAADAICNRLYPFETADNTVPTKYHYLQCKLAIRYIMRRGGEGEISHSENGVSRNYGSVDDADLLSAVVPIVGLGATS